MAARRDIERDVQADGSGGVSFASGDHSVCKGPLETTPESPRLAERGQLAMRLDEGLLRRIFGQMTIPQDRGR
jgi:hypothetical protein